MYRTYFGKYFDIIWTIFGLYSKDIRTIFNRICEIFRYYSANIHIPLHNIGPIFILHCTSYNIESIYRLCLGHSLNNIYDISTIFSSCRHKIKLLLSNPKKRKPG